MGGTVEDADFLLSGGDLLIQDADAFCVAVIDDDVFAGDGIDVGIACGHGVDELLFHEIGLATDEAADEVEGIWLVAGLFGVDSGVNHEAEDRLVAGFLGGLELGDGEVCVDEIFREVIDFRGLSGEAEGFFHPAVDQAEGGEFVWFFRL